VTLVFEVDERPILAVALQNDAASTTAIAPIGSSEGYELFPSEVSGAGTAMSRAGKYLYVIDKIRTWHSLSLFLLFFYLKRTKIAIIHRARAHFAPKSTARPDGSSAIQENGQGEGVLCV
jgi:hypothetical protein